jgi:hypothetical protein
LEAPFRDGAFYAENADAMKPNAPPRFQAAVAGKAYISHNASAVNQKGGNALASMVEWIAVGYNECEAVKPE